MRWIGIDTHKHYVYVTELHENGTKKDYQIKLDNGGIADLKARMGSDAHVIIEATFNSFRLYDELAPHAGKITVAHPSQTRGATTFHLRNDKVSSEILARLLSSDFVREVWVPDQPLRGLRTLVEYRWALTNMRVSMMSRIHSLLHNEIIHLPVAQLMSKKGRRFIEKIDWRDPHIARVRDSLLRVYDAVRYELNEIDLALCVWSQQSDEAHLLMTIPGVGALIAAFILSQIGSIERFPNSRKLCAYAGIVPRVFSSGKTSRTGRITRAGRHVLRWALSLALPHVIRRPGPLSEFHKALCQRRPRRVAHVACMRKLLTVIWHMLRKRTAFKHEDHVLTQKKMKALNLLSNTAQV